MINEIVICQCLKNQFESGETYLIVIEDDLLADIY
jgi:hypothetical protein